MRSENAHFMRSVVSNGIGGMHVGKIEGESNNDYSEKHLLHNANVLKWLVENHCKHALQDKLIEVTDYAKIKTNIIGISRYKLTKKGRKIYEAFLLKEPNDYKYTNKE